AIAAWSRRITRPSQLSNSLGNSTRHGGPMAHSTTATFSSAAACDVAPRLVLAPPLPAPATLFRSTWLLASLQALRSSNLWPRYQTHLAPAARRSIDAVCAAQWLPIELAVSHYEACDRLQLNARELLELGERTSEAALGATLEVSARLGKLGASTPATVLAATPRLWRLVFVGGDVRVNSLRAHDAILELHGCPCVRFEYFRTAFRGVLQRLTARVCERVVVTDLPMRSRLDRADYRVAWV
ncbi:MAG: hypothetical protein ACHREM_23485, partial [Polyangiales bacterium]